MSKRTQPDSEKPRYVLYFRGHREPDVHSRIWVPIYFDPSYAHGMIERFTRSAEVERAGNVLSLVGTPFTITCEQLEAVLSSDPAVVSDDDARTCLRFKLGTWEEDHTKQEVEVVGDDGEVVVKVEKVKPPKPEKAVKPKVPDGYKTITELCAEWKLLPMHARAALRGSGLEKPPYGWAFAPKDIKQIKKICGVK